MCLGAVNLLVVAFAGRHHHVAAVAWVEAALSVGSVLGGLVYGAATGQATPPVRLSLLAGALVWPSRQPGSPRTSWCSRS